jgi:hypothetical protein
MAVTSLGEVVPPLKIMTYSEVGPVAEAARELLDRIGGLAKALEQMNAAMLAEHERRTKEPTCPVARPS